MPTIAEALAAGKIKPPKILLYAPPRSGKTTFCTTAGVYGEIIDCDGNIRPAITVKDAFAESRPTIDYFDGQDTDPVNPDSWDKTKKRIIAINNSLAMKTYKKKIVVLDSLTTMGDAALRYVRKNSKTLASGKQPTQPEWGLALGELEYVLSLIRGWPITVVVNAHDLIYTDTEPVFGPSGSVVGHQEVQKRQILCIGAKLPFKIPALFSEIWYLRRVQGGGTSFAYKLQTQSSNNLIAGSGLGIADMTDTNIGLVELLEKHGIEIKDRVGQSTLGQTTTAPNPQPSPQAAALGGATAVKP